MLTVWWIVGCLGDAASGDAKSAETKIKAFEGTYTFPPGTFGPGPIGLLWPYSTSMGLSKSIEIKSEVDLLGPGAKAGSVPSDLEQSTGLERLEILGKME